MRHPGRVVGAAVVACINKALGVSTSAGVIPSKFFMCRGGLSSSYYYSRMAEIGEFLKKSANKRNYMFLDVRNYSACAESSRKSSKTNATEAVGLVKPLLVSIEGNIGSGKTTLIKALKQKIDEKNKIICSSSSSSAASQPLVWSIIDEPVKLWSSLKGDEDQKSLFDLFYADRKRYFI